MVTSYSNSPFLTFDAFDAFLKQTNVLLVECAQQAARSGERPARGRGDPGEPASEVTASDPNTSTRTLKLHGLKSLGLGSGADEAQSSSL